MQSREIDDEEYVSRYGTRDESFRDRPTRLKDQGRMSLQLGKLTPAQVHRRISLKPLTGDEGVRHARVGDLRSQGFVVKHTPHRGNTEHVSICYPSTWDDEVAGKFRSCFDEPQWHEELEEEVPSE